MRPRSERPARHARLFELIRQGNLAERALNNRRPPADANAEQLIFARLAAQSILPQTLSVARPAISRGNHELLGTVGP